jgi:hypothetical protein
MSLKHGLGSDDFCNGDNYTGSYVEGKFDGKGEYKWAAG